MALLCTFCLILLLFLTFNRALRLPCASNFVLSLPCTCSGTTMHLSPNLVTILRLSCASNLVLSLPSNCSGTAVHLSPSLVRMLYVWLCFDTAIYLYLCLVIALHLQWHCYAPLTFFCPLIYIFTVVLTMPRTSYFAVHFLAPLLALLCTYNLAL